MRIRTAAIAARIRPAVVVSRRRPVVLSLAALVATGLMLLILVNLLSGSGRDPMLDAAAPPPPVLPLACGDLDAKADHARELMARSQLTTALSVASEGLAVPLAPGCANAHLSLARLWYTASVDDLLAVPVSDDAMVRQAPARWATIERRADQLGVPTEERRPAMALAESAYDRGLWQLADAAFRDAWAVGRGGAGGVEFRHALLRNWGYDLAFKGTTADAPRGLAMLQTAHEIARSYDLQSDVACTDLRALGVVDCSAAIADPDEPTLAGLRRTGAP